MIPSTWRRCKLPRGTQETLQSSTSATSHLFFEAVMPLSAQQSPSNSVNILQRHRLDTHPVRDGRAQTPKLPAHSHCLRTAWPMPGLLFLKFFQCGSTLYMKIFLPLPLIFSISSALRCLFPLTLSSQKPENRSLITL